MISRIYLCIHCKGWVLQLIPRVLLHIDTQERNKINIYRVSISPDCFLLEACVIFYTFWFKFKFCLAYECVNLNTRFFFGCAMFYIKLNVVVFWKVLFFYYYKTLLLLYLLYFYFWSFCSNYFEQHQKCLETLLFGPLL